MQPILNDPECLADYNARQLSDKGPDPPEEFLFNWTNDLLTNHPIGAPGDFTYVVETQKGQIVLTLCLIPQNRAYEDIPFIGGMYERGRKRSLFSCIRDKNIWHIVSSGVNK